MIPETTISQWKAYREPLRATVLRTGTIALAGGAVLARFWGGWARWPVAALVVFWPAFGGHWIEVLFLNGLRPRIPRARGWQAAARVGTWFIGGALLGWGMQLTARVRGPAWWIAGLAFVGIELMAHLGLWLLGRANFYDGQG